jgi:trimeric autotransporter adhesin
MNSRTFDRNHRFVGLAAYLCVGIMMLTLAACDGFFPSLRSLDHINVTPTSRFMTVTDPPQQYAASGVNGNGSASDVTASSTWTSSNPAIATVSAAGVVTAVAAGNTTITAASGNVQGSTTLNVTATALTSINLSPAEPTITNGTTQQFTATGTFASPSPTQDITSLVTWTSSDTSKLTINSSGLATGIQAGTAVVTASATTATSTVTVNTTATVQ